MSGIRLANAPCSWGVLEFGLDGTTAGFQQVLDEMRLAGYTGTELGDWGFLPTEPAHLSRELNSRELEMLAAFVPIPFVQEHISSGLRTALKAARLLAQVSSKPCIVLSDENGTIPARTSNAGRIQGHHGLSQNQWKTFTRNVDMVAGKVLEETGVKSVFHHHCAGYVETPNEIARFLAMTDESLVGLCLDTGHYAFGGGDPVSALRDYSGRIWHVHFKDFQPSVAREARQKGWDYFTCVQNGVFCELGKGAVDFPAVISELRSQRYTGWIVVEQDVLPGMGSPLESAKRNREFLRKLGL